MEKLELIKLLNEVSEDHLKVDAIRRLGLYINDAKVLDALCREAIKTDSHSVRDELIRTLKGNQVEANRRFSQNAICAKDPAHRRWALINLSLMECCYAKEAVMQGLRDTHRSVRFAAAFNAGLYYDSDVVNALQLFFERNRFLLVLDNVRQAGKSLSPLIKKLKKIYSDYYHHDDTKGDGDQNPFSGYPRRQQPTLDGVNETSR
jgi:hypothetical protein